MRVCTGLKAFAVSIVALAANATAWASPITYSFTDVGPNYNLTGSLTGTANGDGSVTVNQGTGIYTDASNTSFVITLLPNPAAPNASYSPSGLFIYDDQLFPNNSPVLDSNGLLFTFVNGGSTVELNVWNDGGGVLYTLAVGADVTESQNGQFTIAAVPEPATVGLTGLALLSLGLGLRRRVRQ